MSIHDDLPRHSVSVAGIVFDDDGRVLAIQRRDNKQWQPPGGVLELGEGFEDGLRREVLEETGIHVRVERLTGVYKNMNLGVVALVFRCVAIGGTPQATDESQEVQWVEVDEALTLMSPTFAIRVEDSSLPTAAHRIHDGSTVLRGDCRLVSADAPTDAGAEILRRAAVGSMVELDVGSRQRLEQILYLAESEG